MDIPRFLPAAPRAHSNPLFDLDRSRSVPSGARGGRGPLAGLCLGAWLALWPASAAAQQAPTAAGWAQWVAGDDGRLDAAELARALAELDLDRRASGDLQLALARAQALGARLAAQPAGAERAALERELACALAELWLEAGNPAEAWRLLQPPGPLSAAATPPAGGADGSTPQPGPAASPRELALRERARNSLAAELGLAAVQPQNALEQAVEDALSLSPENDQRLSTLGRAAVPHLLTLCRRNRDRFPLEGRRDPLRALVGIDPRAFLDLALAEFEAGAAVWRTRLQQPTGQLFAHILTGQVVRSELIEDFDLLVERLMVEPATADAMWQALSPFGSSLHHLPRVCAQVAREAHDPRREVTLVALIYNLECRGAVVGELERLAASPLDQPRLTLSQLLVNRERTSPDARRVLLGLAKDPVEKIRVRVASVLATTTSAEERSLRLELLFDPSVEVRQQALWSLCQEQERLLKSGPGPLGLPFADPETLAAVERCFDGLDSKQTNSWEVLARNLPEAARARLLRRMLASGTLELIQGVSQALRNRTIADPALELELQLDLANACRPLANGFDLVWAATQAVLDRPGQYAALLTAAMDQGLHDLLKALTWYQVPNQVGRKIQLQEMTKILDGPTTGRLLVVQCGIESIQEAQIYLVSELQRAPASSLLTVMADTGLSPEVRLLAMARALEQGAPEALELLGEAAVWPALESAIVAVEGGQPWAPWLSGFSRIRSAPEPLRNALTARALSSEGLGDRAVQMLVSALSPSGPQGVELAGRAAARWGGALRDSADRFMLRALLVECQALPAVPLDREFLRRALAFHKPTSGVVEAIRRRGDASLTALLGDELDRRRSDYSVSPSDFALSETSPILEGLSRIASPEALALLAREAGINPHANVRQACLELLENLRRLEEAARWSAERGSLPRTRAQATAELLALLESPDRRQRLAAIEGLGALGQPEVLPDLVRLLSGADAEFEAAIGRAVGRIAAQPGPVSAPQRPFVEPRDRDSGKPEAEAGSDGSAGAEDGSTEEADSSASDDGDE
jgi:hypothetical protein